VAESDRDLVQPPGAGGVLKRGNFPSVADLRDKILAFIDYFNRTLAKPFKWTFTGRPLNV